jgi:hypothetical protein
MVSGGTAEGGALVNEIHVLIRRDVS